MKPPGGSSRPAGGTTNMEIRHMSDNLTIPAASDLRTLAQTREEACVSFYFSIRKGKGMEAQNSGKAKTMLQKAEKTLTHFGSSPQESGNLLAPVRRIFEEGVHEHYQGRTIAVLISPRHMHRYTIPYITEDRVHTDFRFYIKPLVSLLNGNGLLFVLTLNLSGIHLYRVTRYTADEQSVSGMPADIEEAMKYDLSEKQLQYHTVKRNGSNGGQSVAYHGHGTGVDDSVDRIEHFFRLADMRIQAALRNREEPLVLVGLKHLIPIYRKINSYPHLEKRAVSVNPKDLSEDDLCERVWETAGDRFTALEKQAVEEYLHIKKTKKAADNIIEIVPAAVHGRIKNLFVKKGFSMWGKHTDDHIEINPEQEKDNTELSNYAVCETLDKKGGVFIMDSDQFPADTEMAAVFRY